MIAGTLEIQMMANMARLTTDMADAKRTVEGAMKGVERAVASAQAALGSLGIGMSVGYFVNMIKGSIDAADKLNDLNKSTGMTVEQLAGLRLLAKQTGTDLDGLANGILKMSVAIGKDPEKFKALGVTAKDNAGAFKQLADIFNLLPDIQQRNALAQAVFSKSWKEMAPALSEGSQKIGEALEKGQRLSGVTKAMAERADEFNDRLAEFETMSGAFATSVANNMLPGLNNIIKAMLQAREESGMLMAIWVGMGGFFSEFISAKEAAATVGSLTTRIDALAKTIRKLDADKGFKQGLLNDLVNGTPAEQIVQLQATMDSLIAQREELSRKSVAASKTEAKATGELTQAQKDAAEKAAEFLKQQDEAANELINTYNSLVDRINEHNAQLELELKYGRALTEAEKIEIAVKEKLGALAKQDLIDAVAWGVATESEIANRKVIAEQLKEAAKLYQEYLSAFDKETQSTIDGTKVLREQTEEIGLTADALLTLRQARIDNTIATLQSTLAGIDETNSCSREAEAIRGVIAALEDRKKALKENAESTALLDSIKQQADMWKTIDSTAQQTFVSIFNSGKSAFDRLRDTLKNGLYALLYEMTVKKWLINIAASVGGTGVATAAFGANAVGSATGSAVGSSVFGSALSSQFATMAGEMGTWMGGAGNALVGIAADLGVTNTAFLSVAQVIPVVGAIALGVAALTGFFSGGGGPKQGGSAQVGAGGTVVGSLWGMQTEHQIDAQLATTLKTFETGMDATILKLGGKLAGGFTYALGLSSDPAGTAPDFVFAKLTGKSGQTLYNDVNTNVARGQGNTELGVEMNRMMIAALQNSDISAWAKTVVNSIDPVTASADQMSAVMQQLNDGLTAINNAEIARTQLLTSLLTPTEQLAAAHQALANAGIPETVAGFKAMAASLDLTTQSGQQTLSNMINLKNAFDLVQPAADAATAAVVEVGRSLADIASERQRLQDQLDALTMTSAELLAKQRAALDESNRSLFDQIQTAQAAKDAVDAQAKATADLATAAADAAAKLQQQQDQLAAINKGWQDQLDVLTGAETDRSIALRNASDESTRALMRQVYALQDQKTATDAAASAAADAAKAQAAAAQKQADDAQKLYDTAVASVSTAQNNLISAYQRESAVKQDLIKTWQAYSASLLSFKQSLLLGDLSPLSPQQKYATAMSKFNDVSARAQLGDQGAVGDLQNVSNEFLAASRLYNASSNQYTLDFAKVQAALTATAAVADRQVSIAQRELDALTAQVTSLVTLNTSVLSVKDAITALASATSAAAAAQVAAAAAKAALPTAPAVPTVPAAPDTSQIAFATTRGITGLMSDSPMLKAAKILYLSATGGISSAWYDKYVGAVGGPSKVEGWAGDPAALRAYWKFANGGDFVVGGRGGTDTTPVSFMATPGEMVSVRTPAQSNNANNTELLAENRLLRETLLRVGEELVRAQYGSTQGVVAELRSNTEGAAKAADDARYQRNRMIEVQEKSA